MAGETPVRSDDHLLTPDNAALVVIDYQPEQLPTLVKAFNARLAKLPSEIDQSHADPKVKAHFAQMIKAIGKD